MSVIAGHDVRCLLSERESDQAEFSAGHRQQKFRAHAHAGADHPRGYDGHLAGVRSAARARRGRKADAVTGRRDGHLSPAQCDSWRCPRAARPLGCQAMNCRRPVRGRGRRPCRSAPGVCPCKGVIRNCTAPKGTDRVVQIHDASRNPASASRTCLAIEAVKGSPVEPGAPIRAKAAAGLRGVPGGRSSAASSPPLPAARRQSPGVLRCPTEHLRR